MRKIQTVNGTFITDITGKTFGKLTVLELTDKKNNDNRWLWKCQCSCKDKTIIYKTMHDLQSGHTLSCGCYRKEKLAKKNQENSLDITGEKQGTLTALYYVRPSNSGHIWKIQCDCGFIWEMSIGEWNRYKYGNGERARLTCPQCSSRSKGELLIQKILDEHKISFIREWTDNGKCVNKKTNRPLRFDFYLPDYNCCIEYDGIQHFESFDSGYFSEINLRDVQYRDKIKNEYCLNHNIKLIRIPYIDFKNVNWKYLENKLNEVDSCSK